MQGTRLCLVITISGLLAGPIIGEAATRNSADYSVTAESCEAAGARSGSATYTVDAGVGSIGAIGNNSSASVANKSGYPAQLFDFVAITLGLTPATIHEGQTRQINASGLLDDSSFLALDSSQVGWTVLNGPIASVSLAGLATAENVYQDTPATVQGKYQGFSCALNLTVLDTDKDNYGIYAADGIDDAWQVGYFGLDNPLGKAGADADGTGQTNLFKFLAGLNPTDPNSRFVVTAAAVPGHPDQRSITFSPLVAGRSYTVRFCDDLTLGNWQTLTGASQTDNGLQRQIIDASASGPSRFYRVQISNGQ